MKTSKTRPTIYFVEGECEQKLISELKKEPALMVPGKARVFNVLTKRISSSQLMVIKPGTNVCMVFDITQMWCTKAFGVFSKLENKGIEDIIIA